MDKVKDYIDKIDNAERRFMTFEARAEDDGKIVGIASKVNERYNLGWFEEEIAPGAFDEVLEDDVRVLFNHDPNMILARTGAGTAELYLTDEGHLGYRYKTPNTTVGRDVDENVRLGNISQSSFAFTIKDEDWIERDGEVPVRKITKIKRLYDVSPVTYPASPSTEVAKRSHDKKEPEVKPNADHTAGEAEVKYSNLENYKLKQKILNHKKKSQ